MTGSALQAMEHAWAALRPLNVPMAMAGGMAMAVWDRVRATLDLDILVCADGDDVVRIADAMIAAGFVGSNTPAVLGPVELFQFTYRGPGMNFESRVDLVLARHPFPRHVVHRAVEIALDVSMWRVVTCEDLILLKLLAGRLMDRVDVSELVYVHEPQIDWPYLLKWAAELDVVAPLKEAWNDVIPDRALPEAKAT